MLLLNINGRSSSVKKSAGVLTSADEFQQFTAAGQRRIFTALSPLPLVTESH
ncbi:hypothetical protein SynMVIR181_01870 [Synechococcus sp. MVIR-18-1]|nr:hypothetical protein SynMVIR181_01870 [Synechococcus sp. MVIR-18-1]